MYGNMMQMPLLISALLRHADAYHGDTEIVSRLAPGEIHHYTYRDAHRRVRQLANALASLGDQRAAHDLESSVPRQDVHLLDVRSAARRAP